ncbi:MULTISPECIES: NAD-dependent epimerase/dehydratase family protein [Actinomadura]|uniref:NAD-dependent epimerase/dehydratase family protein n=1 Tax=Actinomadura miaoliensis TaxID=430685 RepID=A0ABP7V2I5_9ACTN
MRTVVTGVAGFLGSHVAEALLARGHTVLGVDRRSPDLDETAARNLAGALERPGFRLVVADLNHTPLEPLLDEAVTVYHLAAVPGVRASWGPRFGAYVASNVLATRRVVAACARVRTPRLVFASSSSVYGTTTGLPSREDDPTLPASPYGMTKLAAERLCLAHAREADARTSVVALRYFTLYGPRQRPDMMISRVLRAALTGEPVRVYGDGTQRRDFTYVGDAVAATLAAGAVAARAEAVNVGGGAGVSLRELLDLAAEVTGRPVPVIDDVPQRGDVAVTCADLAKARDLLGHVPATGLAEGLARQWEHLTAAVTG